MLDDLSRSGVRFAFSIGLSAAFAVVAGCDDRSPTSPTLRRDQLELVRMVPAGGSRIPAGQTVRCEAVIRYEFLSATGGRLSLESWWNSPLIGFDPTPRDVRQSQQLDSRRGEATLVFDLPIPASSVGQTRWVRFELHPGEASEASVWADVSYAVVAQ